MSRLDARALSVLATLALAGAAGAADPSEELLRSLASATGQHGPFVRIGLEDGHRIALSSAGAFRIVDAVSGRAVWRESYRGEVQVLAEGGPLEAAEIDYRVQVGAFAEREAAERESRRLAELAGAPAVVRHDPDRGTWRVRVGSATDRLALEPVMERLRAAGVQGLWIAEEPRASPDGVRLRLVDHAYETTTTALGRLVVVPETPHVITVGGKGYRGVVELRISPWGTVRPINWIGLEDYLRGVVPAELGPEVWPELAALEAQAVAARTYAWRNLGQFSDEGYDLCATPRCQVYAGADAEHPLSDRAVRSTAGQVLTWKGQPIVALYTATCGGHTEDGALIFAEHAEPYLTGVACRAEASAVEAHRATLSGAAIESVRDETGRDVSRDWHLLATAGVISRELDAASALRPLTSAELREWTRALCRLARRPAPAGEPRSASTLGAAASALIADLGWQDRARVLLAEEDLPALLRAPDVLELPADERRSVAYLAWLDALHPFADGRLHPERTPTRARLAVAFVRFGESYDAFGLARGVVARAEGDRLRLVQGLSESKLPLARGVRMFGRVGGAAVPASRLEIWPGDSLAFRSDAEGRIDFLELLAPVAGAADDRSSRLYSWEVRKSRRELEAAIGRRSSVGRLVDLRVVRRGVSGRVVELEVVGSEASVTVRGFDVRRLLDLRESLIVLEIQRDAAGEVEAVVFAGKGWGHGVGLCQVGAYGMALRGASYRQILGHYYTGTELMQLPGG